MAAKKVLISGCSGGGKSTLLTAFGALAYPIVPEPGRRIVDGEMRGNGKALPWVDLHEFARRAIDMAQADLAAADNLKGFVFFDRGLIDAAVACEFAGGASYRSLLGDTRHYAQPVFLAPPWPEIFVTDHARRHSFDDATAEYQRLTRAFSELGYDCCELPKAPVQERVAFVLNTLGIA
ncbi:AAA family ATPase [Tateyamaria armeniaca]|uniref:AAA family ATPase n=1 Tax=Tateyamaria armeniaca TaxID=2518930 RepID=A0ABW8UVQ6_9RHOB